MSQSNKKVNVGVLYLLKSVMDNKVKTLKKAVDAGKRAAHEETYVCERIASLQNFAANNRYDRGEVMEAEREIFDYELQAGAIRQKINRGVEASKQLAYADEFYKTCASVENDLKLRMLEAERVELENRLAFVEKNMESCEISMSPALYSEDIACQAGKEYEYFSAEYSRLSGALGKLMADIRQLKR